MSRGGLYEEAGAGPRHCRCGGGVATWRLRITGPRPRGEYLCDNCEAQEQARFKSIREMGTLEKCPGCNERWLECTCFPGRTGL